MSPPRKAPHCKTCHKPLKGHKRGVCDIADLAPSSPTPPHSGSAKTTRPRKSAPPPLEKLPTLSPQSSQILNTLLRTNSHNTPPKIEVPSPKRSVRSASTSAREAESLHVAMERLSAGAERSRTPSERGDDPAESDEEQHLDLAETQASGLVISQLPGLQTSNEASILAPDKKSSATTSQQQASIQSSATIQNFLDRTAQSSHYPPATIFSFPANAVPELEDGAQRLGLFVHVLPLPTADEEWVPVVVGRDAGAVSRLLEDSEKLAQAVGKSGPSGVGEFRVGMSHIVAGTLGALATWAGLAYS